MDDQDPHSPAPPRPPGSPPRAHFDRAEVAAALSYYPLGTVRSVRALALGSSRAPKAVVTADSGEYLLKRRAPGKDDPARVAFAHGLQLHLAAAGFPVARLVPAGADSMVRLSGHVYELFGFVHGTRYDASIAETTESAATLARLHALSANFPAPWPGPPGTYHNAPPVVRNLRAIPARLGEHAIPLTDKLVSTYARSASVVERMGFARWPAQVAHGDWHPGNLLFERGRIIAVLDFDAARTAPRAIDIANGALQFSMTLHPTPPAQWPTGLDLPRVRAFLAGYDTTEGAVISRTELAALPSLMIEALIGESAPPIAATGRFARLDGHEFLLMVDRQAAWIEAHSREISGILG